ncbi:MAG: flavodoxin [Frankiales bacterium]|nr:flavodoxin [Frankiales bacterium]
MPRLLVVHHTPSPAMQALLEAVLEGARDPELAEVEVVTRAALAAGPVDVLAADAVLLGTPANIGYMSGALKHFFDLTYYPVLQETAGLPFGLWVHGQDDTAGAERSVLKVAGGLGWKQSAAVVSVTGDPSRDDLAACTELGGTLAAVLFG